MGATAQERAVGQGSCGKRVHGTARPAVAKYCTLVALHPSEPCVGSGMGKKAEPPAPPSLQAFNDRAALGKNVLWSCFCQDLEGVGQRVSSGEAGQQVSLFKVPAKNRELRFLGHASKGTGERVRKAAVRCDMSLTAGRRDWSSEQGGRPEGSCCPAGPSPSHPNFIGQSRFHRTPSFSTPAFSGRWGHRQSLMS